MNTYLGNIFQQLAHRLATLALGAFDAFQLCHEAVDLVRQSAHGLLGALNSAVHQQRLLVVQPRRLAGRLDLVVFRIQLALYITFVMFQPCERK